MENTVLQHQLLQSLVLLVTIAISLYFLLAFCVLLAILALELVQLIRLHVLLHFILDLELLPVLPAQPDIIVGNKEPPIQICCYKNVLQVPYVQQA